MQSPWTTNVIVSLCLIGTISILAITVGITASKSGTTVDFGPRPTTTTGPTTSHVTTTSTAVATTAPAVIPMCGSSTRMSSPTNYTIVLPQNRTFGFNVLMGNMVQQFLDGAIIPTEAITSACQDGTTRFLTASPDNQVLYSLSLTGTMWQPLSAWTFQNVFGFAKRGGDLFVLTDSNELVKLLLGSNYAIIVDRKPLPVPGKYLTIDVVTAQGYVLLTNNTIATIDLDTAEVQSVCTPTETYTNIGFNYNQKLVGTLPFFVDTFDAI